MSAPMITAMRDVLPSTYPPGIDSGGQPVCVDPVLAEVGQAILRNTWTRSESSRMSAEGRRLLTPDYYSLFHRMPIF